MSNVKNTKDKKAISLAITLLVILLFLSILLVIGFNNTKQMAVTKDNNINNVLTSEWNYIYSVINENYANAKEQSEIIKTNIISDINEEYGDDTDRLQADLQNVAASDTLIQIFGSNIDGVYLNDIKNDANDPFISSRNYILSDLSLDCSSTERTRSFETEISMHFNRYLARQALDSIVMQKDKQVFWNFSNVEFDSPWYDDIRDIESMNITVLKDLFFKHKDINTLKTFEFISTAYVLDRSDVAGEPIVNYNGNFNEESVQLFVNSGFNVVDIINDSIDGKKIIDDYSKQISNIQYEYDQSLRNSYTLMIIECIAFIITLVAIPKIQFRVLDKD